MDEKIIDIESILRLLKKWFWFILVITALTTFLGWNRAEQMRPYYQGRAKIFVGKGEKLLDYYTPQEIYYYQNFINTFKEIITIDDFLNGTLQKYNIDKTAAQVAGSLGFSAAENSPIFTVTYTSGIKEGIDETLTAICTELCVQAEDIIEETNARIIDTVKVSTIMPNKRNVIVTGFGFGLLFSIGLVFVIDYLDDRIIRREDLSKLIPVPVLGDLPMHEKEFVKEERKNASNT